MSSKKELHKISLKEIEKVNISTLADRPNSTSRYGIGGLTAQGLKERFDAFPALVKERLNAIITALSSKDAAAYITLDGSIGGVDNLYDFLALFCEKVAGENNISDYISALYTKLNESEPTSNTLQQIVDDIVGHFSSIHTAIDESTEISKEYANVKAKAAEDAAKEHADEQAKKVVGSKDDTEESITVYGARAYADVKAKAAEDAAKKHADEQTKKVVGSKDDTEESITVYGARAYAKQEAMAAKDSALAGAKEYADKLVSAGWIREVVTNLPTPENAKPNVVYMIKRSEGLDANDVYDEYFLITVNGVPKLELMGNTELDLSQYTPIGSENDPSDKKTYHGLHKRIEELRGHVDDVFDTPGLGYDLVILSEGEFHKCLYPLFQDETLTKEEALAAFQAGTASLGTPDGGFTAKRVLVKDVNFTKQCGFDDIRMHIFQPSIEYIKFENCRWETVWYLSGKVPSTIAFGDSQFKKAEGDLGLVIDGIEVTADNVQAAKNAGVYWYIGLRNIKALINSVVRYPEGYDIGDGWSFKLTCQYFDYASNNKIPAFWDGSNISDCYVTEKLVRCTNCVNIVASPVLKNGEQNSITVQSCNNISNFYGSFTFDNGCKNISASKEDIASAEENVKKDAQAKYLPIQKRSGLKAGEYFLYATGLSAESENVQTQVHARPKAAKNEIPLRTQYGTILSAREWSDSGYDYSDKDKWSEATLMPRDYIDRKINTTVRGCEKRIEGIEQYLGGDNFIVDDSAEYQKTVPKNACENAKILSVGGMSYKSENLAKMVNGTHDLTHTYSVTLNNGHARIDKKASTIKAECSSEYFHPYTEVVLPKGIYTLRFSNVRYSNLPLAGLYLLVDDEYLIYGDPVVEACTVYIDIPQEKTIKYGFYMYDEETYSVDGFLECDVMINIGSTAIPYAPYFEGLHDAKATAIESVGGSLIPYPYKHTTKAENGITFVDNGDGSISIKGTATSNAVFYLYDDLGYGCDFITPGEYYSRSAKGIETSDTVHFMVNGYRRSDAEGDSFEWFGGEKTVQAPSDFVGAIMYIVVLSGATVDTIVYPMLNKGKVAFPYSPHNKHSLSIPAEVQAKDGYGLGINKEYHNYIDWKAKKLYVKCKKVVLDGSDDENWTIDSEAFKISLPDISSAIDYNFAYFVCDKYQEHDGVGLPNMPDMYFYGKSSYFGYGAVAFKNSLVALNITAWREYLKTNPITLVYSLNTPDIIDISDVLLDNGIIPVEGGGVITMMNEHMHNVPSTVKYLVTYPKEV